jgi:hypothetical protein
VSAHTQRPALSYARLLRFCSGLSQLPRLPARSHQAVTTAVFCRAAPRTCSIGNHETEADGDGDAVAGRYLNQTFGLPFGNPLATSKSSATSGLGHLLTKGTYLAPGLHGTTPSGSSAYFSVDVGLIHITALSTQNPQGDELVRAVAHND